MRNDRHGPLRPARGSELPGAKLTEGAVSEILALLPDLRLRDIAARYGVSPMTISLIKRGVTWAHVPRPPGFDPPARADFGERNSQARLRAEQVRAIYASTVPDLILAEQYGVAPGAIWAIRADKRWTRVTAPLREAANGGS